MKIGTSRNLRLDSRPLYAKTVEALYELIEEGTFPADQLLPSEEELSRHFGVSRSTLREAISHLERDGLIVRRHGVGTFVTRLAEGRFRGGLERMQSFRVLAALNGEQAETFRKRVTRVQVNREREDILNLSTGSELLRVEVVEGIDKCRTAYIDSYIKPELVDIDELQSAEGSLLDYLVEYTDLSLSYTRSEVYAIDATEEVADWLNVPQGKSLLHLDETMYTEANESVVRSYNYFITDCFGFFITRRVVRSRKTASGK